MLTNVWNFSVTASWVSLSAESSLARFPHWDRQGSLVKARGRASSALPARKRRRIALRLGEYLRWGPRRRKDRAGRRESRIFLPTLIAVVGAIFFAIRLERAAATFVERSLLSDALSSCKGNLLADATHNSALPGMEAEPWTAAFAEYHGGMR